MANPVVLAIDDEEAILRLIGLELASAGFDVLTAANGEEAISTLEIHHPDVALIDVLMPGMDGFEILEALRARQPIPAIFMSARNREQDRQRAFQMGAEDYLVKPFGVDELAGRLRTILHMPATAGSGAELQIGSVVIDLGRRTVRCGDRPLELSRTEWKIVDFLARNAGQVVTSNDLLANVWGPEYAGDTQYLGMWIARLQRKLEEVRPDAAVIQAHPGVGYRLAAPNERSNIA